MIRFALAVLLSMVALNSSAQTCELSIPPSIECMDKVVGHVSYDMKQAAQVCRNGVQINCLDKLLPHTGYDMRKAADACRGNVSLACIDKLLPHVGYKMVDAAALCKQSLLLSEWERHARHAAFPA